MIFYEGHFRDINNKRKDIKYYVKYYSFYIENNHFYSNMQAQKGGYKETLLNLFKKKPI